MSRLTIYLDFEYINFKLKIYLNNTYFFENIILY